MLWYNPKIYLTEKLEKKMEIELKELITKMEEMAGAPREDGTYERQPGERCSYELPPKTKTKTTTMAQVP